MKLRNIWGTEAFPRINQSLITLGYVQIGNFPIRDGVIDYQAISIAAQSLISLSPWEVTLGHEILFEHKQRSFLEMIHHCKINKFYEVNFKILHCILATPSLVAKIRKDPTLAQYFYCGALADINHILLNYTITMLLYENVCESLDVEITPTEWILGHSCLVNPVIWLTNFTLYKAHLMATEWLTFNVNSLLHDTFVSYSVLFPQSSIGDLL